jgi:hypothetical protein
VPGTVQYRVNDGEWDRLRAEFGSRSLTRDDVWTIRAFHLEGRAQFALTEATMVWAGPMLDLVFGLSTWAWDAKPRLVFDPLEQAKSIEVDLLGAEARFRCGGVEVGTLPRGLARSMVDSFLERIRADLADEVPALSQHLVPYHLGESPEA